MAKTLYIQVKMRWRCRNRLRALAVEKGAGEQIAWQAAFKIYENQTLTMPLSEYPDKYGRYVQRLS